MLRLLCLSICIASSSAFFFGNSGGCGCVTLPPLCLPNLLCPPAPACPPVSPCGGGYPAAPPAQYAPPAPSYAVPPPPSLAEPLPSIPQPLPQPILGPQQPVYQQPQELPQIQQNIPQPIPQQVAPQQVIPQQVVPQQVPQQGNYANVPLVVAQQDNFPQQVPQQVQPQPQDINYQGPVGNAARDAEQGELVQVSQKLQQEATAAGQTNEEVIEEQDRALEKSVDEVSTVSPAASSTSAPDTAEERIVDISALNLTDDPLCNSEDLRKVMLENIDENLNSSKRLIQLAAEAQFGGRFDVICANGDFSYVTNTELFCQETKGDISCYTYRQL
ncbi:hypothetical protein Q1695_004022 [Nippostrongylus brasiliensis]|nr:hypothetical protein Q1695_004022 [Nippostrongylus brasiliensis]